MTILEGFRWVQVFEAVKLCTVLRAFAELYGTLGRPDRLFRAISKPGSKNFERFMVNCLKL